MQPTPGRAKSIRHPPQRQRHGFGSRLIPAIGWAIAAPLLAIAPWSAPIGVLDQHPIEMAQALPGVDVGGTKMPVAIVFDSVPRLRLGLLDPAGGGGNGAMSFVTIDGAGTNFALGTIAETTSGRIGGSYVTSGFDLRFWTCLSPCTTVSTFAIDTAATWIDSNSAAAGADFVVAGLDNATGFVHLYTSPDGSTWTALRTIAPTGGLYRNFNGGERIALAVDANPMLQEEPTSGSAEAPDGVGTNCLFYEVITSFPAVQKRIDCADGPTPIPFSLVMSDTADAGNQPGPLIENRFFMDNGVVVGVLTRRQDGKIYAVRHVPGGAVSSVPLGNAPSGPEFFGLTMAGGFSYDTSRPLSIFGETGVQLNFVVDDDPFQLAGVFPGPIMGDEGPISLLPSPPGCIGTGCIDLHMVAPVLYFNAAPETTTVGVGISRRPLAFFEDGFDIGTTDRWSAAAP